MGLWLEEQRAHEKDDGLLCEVLGDGEYWFWGVGIWFGAALDEAEAIWWEVCDAAVDGL